MAIAIIPARGGSERIPRKNIKLFHGKPIIAYSIEAAQQSAVFSDIYVSTDDDEVAKIAIKYGAEVVSRSAKLSENDVGTQEVAKSVIEALDYIGKVCVIYATAPLMSVNDLRLGFGLICSGSDYAFSVGDEPLSDAGQFYWGHDYCFRDETPLVSTNAAMIPIDSSRVCDINTTTDWHRAEEMYTKLSEGAK